MVCSGDEAEIKGTSKCEDLHPPTTLTLNPGGQIRFIFLVFGITSVVWKSTPENKELTLDSAANQVPHNPRGLVDLGKPWKTTPRLMAA